MLRSGTTSYTPGRLLASLKWAGITSDRNGLFVVPRNLPAALIADLEHLCAKDDRFDWCFDTDKAGDQ